MPRLFPADSRPVCPDCGNDLPAAGHGCPHCGFSPHAPHAPEGPFAFFGPGFWGFLIGALATLVLLAADQTGSTGRTPLLGFLLCPACGAITSVVGKHIGSAWRRGYEHLLVGLVIGGLVNVAAVMVRPLPIRYSAAIWFGAAAVSFLLRLCLVGRNDATRSRAQ